MTKNTRKAFLASVISFILCVTMLIGSTFAWFTDSATTGVNKIATGNLDIKLSYMNAKTDATYSEVSKDTTDLFVNKDGKAMLWEPGAVSVCYFKLENIGTLALKYKAAVIANDTVTYNGHGLSEALKTAVVTLTEGQKLTNEEAIAAATAEGAKSVLDYTASGEMLGKDAAEYAPEYFAMVIYFPTDADDTYNAKGDAPALEVELYLSFAATQLNSESDSFGSDYDKDATITLASGQTDLNSAVTEADGLTTIILSGDSYTLPTTSMANKELVFKGDGETALDMTTIPSSTTNANITFEGMNVQLPTNQTYHGLTHTEKVVYKDCKITGLQSLYAKEVEFINCEFVNMTDYCVWTYGASNVTFTNCTFTTGGKAVLVYNEYTTSSFVANVTMNDCTFTSDGTLAKDKAAVETGSNGGNTATSNKYNLAFNGCTITGFAENKSTSTLWGNKNSMDTDHLNVKINGTDVY